MKTVLERAVVAIFIGISAKPTAIIPDPYGTESSDSLGELHQGLALCADTRDPVAWELRVRMKVVVTASQCRRSGNN